MRFQEGGFLGKSRVKSYVYHVLMPAAMMLVMLAGGLIFHDVTQAAAAKVDYTEGTMVIKPGSTNVKKYAYVALIKAKDESTAKAKAKKLKGSDWDKYPYVEIDGVKYAEVDISGLAAKKPSYVAYKLNSDGAYTLVTIGAQITNLKVSYNPSKVYEEMNGGASEKTAKEAGAFTFRLKNAKTGTKVEEDAVQVRKQNGSWVSYGAISVRQLVNFHVKGATLYFRIAAEQKITSTEKSYWPGKQVKLRLAKSAKGRTVAVDGSRLTAGVKKDQEYSFDGMNWVNVAEAHGTKNSSGKDVVNPVSIYNMYQTFDKTDASKNVIYPMNAKLQDPSPVAFYVRTAATEKRPASKEVLCELTQSVVLTKELLPQIGYQLNYSTKSGIQVTNTTTSALQIAIVDSSKIFTTPAATGTKNIKFKVETVGENQDTIVVPVNEASESEVLTGEAINGECFDLAAAKGDHKITWIDIAKGTADKPKVTKIGESKYSEIPADKRIILVRFKSVPKTKTEAMKIASDIVAMSMPVSEKQTLTVSSISGLSGGDTQGTTGVSLTVGSGATATKEFIVSVNATKMNAEYVPVNVSWVDAQGKAGTKPAGTTVSCSGSNRIHAGSGKVIFKINKKAKTGTYYAKLKAENASVIIEVKVYNGNPVIEFETSTLNVSGSGNSKITVYGVSEPGALGVNNYGTVKYELYKGERVSGSSIIASYSNNMGFSSWEAVEDDTKGNGYKGTFWVDKTNGGSSLPAGTYCLEVLAANATGTTSETMVIKVTD